MAFEITDANFQKEVLENNGVAVLDFWAEWCGPCRMIGPIIDKLHTEYEGKALIGKVNVDENSEIPVQFGITSIPTILIFKNGKMVEKHVGVTTQANLAQKIEAQLAA
ncbi:MAG: thioredoxin [Saprospiraceae bacterium]|jgi:thioredoxin 1|nr:thioredoxin [Saprospiraceae bacterium]